MYNTSEIKLMHGSPKLPSVSCKLFLLRCKTFNVLCNIFFIFLTFDIFLTIENSAKCFCISNDLKCVTKVHNRIGCTCLAYCYDDLKQFFFHFAQLPHCEEQFCSFKTNKKLGITYIISGDRHTVQKIILSFIYQALLMLHIVGIFKQIFYKSNYKLLRYGYRLS